MKKTILYTFLAFVGFLYGQTQINWNTQLRNRPNITRTGANAVWTDNVSMTQFNGCQHVNANQTFAAALAAATNPGCIVVDPGTFTVSTSATIPSGVTLAHTQGGKLSISPGQTLTANGPLSIGNYQAFITTGTGSPVAITAATESTSGSAIAITAAAEVGNICTITSTLNPTVNSTVIITGVTPAGYNSPTGGGWTVVSSSASSFTFFNTTTGLGAGSVFGTAQVATNTVTFTSTLNPTVGMPVTVAGVTPSIYNSTYLVLTTSVSNFTVYHPIAGIAAGSAFGTATQGGAVKFNSVTESIVRPEWFGAVADGSSTTPITGTDNYAAFLMAHNTLPAYNTPTQGTTLLKNGQLETNGRMLLSQGRYVTSSTLQWSPFTTYECPSYRGCMIALQNGIATAGPEMWTVDLSPNTFSGNLSPNTSFGGQFRNIHIDCNGGYFYGTNTRSSGLQFAGAQGSSMGSLWVQNCGNRGLFLTNVGSNGSGLRGPSDVEVLGVTIGPGVELDGNTTYFSSINAEQVNLNSTFLDPDGDPNPNVLIGSGNGSGGCFNCNIIVLGTEFGGLPLKIWNGAAINIMNLALQPQAAGQPTAVIISHGARSVVLGPMFVFAGTPQVWTNWVVDRTTTPTTNVPSVGSFPTLQGYAGTGLSPLNALQLPEQSSAPGNLAAAGFEGCYGDSTAHAIKCSYNNGAYTNVPLLGLAQTWTGTQTFPSPVITGTIPTYNGSNTSGQGLVPILCSTLQKSESAADANVLTCTIPAQLANYRVRFTLAVSAANAATLGWTATWTSPNIGAVTPTNLSLFQSGTALPALTFTTSAATELYGYIDIDNAASGNIVVKLTFSGTSFTAVASATVERII